MLDTSSDFAVAFSLLAVILALLLAIAWVLLPVFVYLILRHVRAMRGDVRQALGALAPQPMSSAGTGADPVERPAVKPRRWRVSGVDRESGLQTEQVVSATDEREARGLGLRGGIDVQAVEVA